MKKIEIKSKQFQNVLKKAIAVRPLVRPVPFVPGAAAAVYLVAGSRGGFYSVGFARGSAGEMLYSCPCAGAGRGFYCYHLAAALLAHSAFVSGGLRAPAPSRVLASFTLPAAARAKFGSRISETQMCFPMSDV